MLQGGLPLQSGSHFIEVDRSVAAHAWVRRDREGLASQRDVLDARSAARVGLRAVVAEVARIADLSRLDAAVAAHDVGGAISRDAWAGEEGLLLAGRRAAVAADEISVVTFFAAYHQVVAADRTAPRAAAAKPALQLAARVAAVAVLRRVLTVVALFVGGAVAIAAGHRHASLARCAKPGRGIFQLAARVAAVARLRCGLAVVALLAALTHTVAAHRARHAGLTGLEAAEARLHGLAVGAAAVAVLRRGFAVVADLAPLDHAVAAEDHAHAVFARVYAQVVRVDAAAVGAAAIAIARVAVVTQLHLVELAVAAHAWSGRVDLGVRVERVVSSIEIVDVARVFFVDVRSVATAAGGIGHAGGVAAPRRPSAGCDRPNQAAHEQEASQSRPMGRCERGLCLRHGACPTVGAVLVLAQASSSAVPRAPVQRQRGALP
jgi:hypothetical protein